MTTTSYIAGDPIERLREEQYVVAVAVVRNQKSRGTRMPPTLLLAAAHPF